MKELARNEAFGSFHLFPGDQLTASHRNSNGRKDVVGVYEITKPMIVDTLVIIETEPGELGLSNGLGCVFGKRIK